MQTKSPPAPIFYGWFIVGITFFIALITVGGRQAFGAFVLPMSDQFGWTRSEISLAASIGFLINGLSQPFVGQLYDKLGGRVVILTGLVIFGLSTLLLYATFHLVYLIVMFGFVMSLANSGASLNLTNALLARWFRRKRGTVLGLSTSGASFGSLLVVPFTMYMIQAAGWRTTWLVLGILILAVALPLAFFFLRDDPKDMGLQPDGDPEPSDVNGRDEADFCQEAPLEARSWREAFHSLPIWQMTLAYVICGFTTAVMSIHFIPYAIEKGFSEATAATAFGVMGFFNAVGVIVFSFLSERYGRKNMLGLVYTARGCGYALLLLAPGAWGLWGFAVLAGFGWIATAALTTSLTSEVYGLKTLGTVSGVAFLAHQVGAFTSIQLAGVLRDVTGDYTLAFTVIGSFLIVAALSSFTIQEKKYSIKYRTVPAASGTYGN